MHLEKSHTRIPASLLLDPESTIKSLFVRGSAVRPRIETALEAEAGMMQELDKPF